jgi:signal transduction histidine kinase
LLGAGLIIVTVALPPAARGSDLLILGYGAVSGIAGALLLRRPRVSEPVLGLAAALGTAVITLSTLEAGSGVGAEDNQVLYLWVCVFSFWFLSTRHALLQVGLIGAADAVLLLDEGPTLAAGVTRWLVIVTTFVTIGLLIAWVRRALDRQRAETARLAAVAERIRIARELQDATGAGVAAVSVQATAGLSAIDRDPEATRRALEEIARTAKTTLQDMRRLLGVLRPEDPGDAFDRVSLTGTDELVAECRRAGIPVEVGISGEPIQLPEALDQAAYRIAQEALTNVLRHGGPDAMARLRLGYDAEGVSIEVTNKGRPAAEAGAESGGKGLAGMRERVEMFGGALETGPLEGGGFRVHARLPVRAPVANA